MSNAKLHGVDDAPPPLADEVLAYLVRHPQAEDTAEGIAEWWLPKERNRHAILDVEGALSELARDGFLVARQCRDGRTYYRLNRDREQEVRQRLRQVEASQEREPGPA